MWEVENIPDGDFLFFRVHKSYVPDGELIPGVFQDRGGGMSTDWDKYSTASESRNRAKVPNDNGIIKLNVAGIRSLEKLTVVHEPENKNRSHSEVFGEKTTEVRLKLKRLAEWAVEI